jgi:GH18 family chitinase
MIRWLFGLFVVLLALAACETPKIGLGPSASSPGASSAGPRPKPNKIILGYSYAGVDAKWPPADYDYSEVTHITRCFLMFQEDGSMTDGGIFDPKLAELAKKNGVKLMASIGGWAGGEFDHTWYKMARDPTARRRFFDNLDKIITSHGYDGVDIDWEPLVRDDLGPAEIAANQKTFAEFMVALRARFPKWILTAAIGAGSSTLSHVSWKELTESVDYVNLMAYDYSGVFTKHAAHNASLYAPSSFTNKADEYIDMTVNTLLQKYNVVPGKILLGIPFYGHQFSADKMGQSLLVGAVHPGEQILYADVAPLAASGDYKKLWDGGGRVPFLEKSSGGHTVSYDDEKSVAEKCRYARDKGFAGVLAWALGQDLYAGRPVLLDAIAEAMGVPRTEPPIDYMKKYYDARIGDAKKVTQEIVKAQGELMRLDKGNGHKPFEPLQEFSGLGSTKSERGALAAQIEKAEKLVYRLKTQLDEVEKRLDLVPLANRAGKVVRTEQASFLVSDFERGNIEHSLGGSWEGEFDRNGIGTTMSPNPLKVTDGGRGGSKGCIRFWGHFGRSGAAPWPYADIGASMPNSDLSQFNGIRFWAKGNGKKYMVVLRRGAVRDYGHFRAAFTTSHDWTEVHVKFDDLQQPDWARPVARAWVDVTSIAFMPDILFSDEDYDLSLDDVQLVK